MKAAGDQGIQDVKTADFEVEGKGRVEVVSPEPMTKAKSVVSLILNKAEQAPVVQVELPSNSVVTPEETQRFPNRIFGHSRGVGSRIQRIVVLKGDKVLLDATRMSG